MVSCTGCGRTLKERHKFCPRCGTAINHTAGTPVAEPDNSVVHPDIPSGFDRQTMFSTGILVLTRENLILYGRNGRDEIRNIPVELIQSCSVRRLIKKALVVKWRINIEENFKKYWAELQLRPNQLMNKAQHYRRLAEQKSCKMANTEKAANRIASDVQKTLNRAYSMEDKARQAVAEAERLQVDAEYAWQVKLKNADIRKDTFTLPSKRASKHSPSDEYKIWSYMIRRRMAGPANMQITSSPPEAVVLVDDVIMGTTPLTIEKPLTEAAALNGKYHIKILLEDHRSKSLRISSAPDQKSLWNVGPIEKALRIASVSSKSDSVNVQMVPRKRPNSAANQTIGIYREKIPDSTINPNWYNLELETPGTESTLALVHDRVLVISSDKKRLLMEIPYSQVAGARVEKKFLRGIQGITISYRSEGMSELEYGFELDTSGSSDSVSLMRHHCETIVERLQAHAQSAAEQAIQQNAGPPATEQQAGGGAVGAPVQYESLDTESLIVREKSDISWDDVVGLEDAKKALYASIIYPAKRPDLFPMGWPKGMLLYGPPGTGKTMLAAATANKMDGYFFNLSGSAITSKWVGESEENVAQVFKTARGHAARKPVILFIDEADSLLGADDAGQASSHRHAKNQFLTEMDGVHTKGDQLLLFVMGATNKPWTLDMAFLRRFQRRIYVPLPNIEARELLFRQYSKDLRTDGSVDIQGLARDSEGYSASDIRDICQTVHLDTLHDLFEASDQGGVTGNTNPRAITTKDFQGMLSRRKPSVSSEMHEKYQEWSLKHGTGDAAKQNEEEPVGAGDFIVREKPKVEWDDVVGLEDAKKALYASVIYPAKRPDLFPMGWPKGMLLYGPPGTGKTMLAAATVNKMDGYFFNLPASTITSKWVGESEENVAKVFKTAREHAKKKPVVLFIDEADSLLGGDESGQKTGYSYAKNQFLTEMDGVHTKGDQLLLFVMGATNKPWALDMAFLRRFQKRVYIPLPSSKARELLFRQYTDNLSLDPSVVMRGLARITRGYSGSDIRDVCQGVHLETVHDLFEVSGKNDSLGDGQQELRIITKKDFQDMLSRRKPSVSSDMHAMYQKWSDMYGAG